MGCVIRIPGLFLAAGVVAVFAASRPAAAAWPPDPDANLPVCTATHAQTEMRVIAQGAGGVYAVWTDFRGGMPTGLGDYYELGDVYLQRITASGEVSPGWPLDGVPVCREARRQGSAVLATDGRGGVFVAWVDHRAVNGDADLYLQHITPQGLPSPGWPASGRALHTRSNADPRDPALVPDGEGGVIVVFTDVVHVPSRDYYTSDVFAVRVTADARNAPGWTEGGDAICTTEITETDLVAASDGSGGAVLAWSAYDTDLNSNQKVAHRVLGTRGIATGWAPNGTVIGPFAPFLGKPAILHDGAGGVRVAWADARDGDYDVYLGGVTAAGAIVASIPSEGRVVGIPGDTPKQVRLAADGTGGAYLAWVGGAADLEDIQLLRITLDGGIAAGWPAAGLGVCVNPGQQFDVALAHDGQGHALLAWPDLRAGGGDIYAARVGPAGALASGWTANGVMVTGAPNLQHEPALVADGSGGLVIVWADERLGINRDETDIYAARLDAAASPGGSIPGTPETIAFSMYPNPAGAWVELTVPPDGARWRAEILDAAGRRVWREDASGRTNLRWDGRDEDGRRASAGLYWVRFSDGGRSRARRLAWMP